MISPSLNDSIEEDFRSAERDLFKSTESEECEEECGVSKPRVLWCAYFRYKDTTSIDVNSKVPAKLFLTSSPSPEQDYEHAVAEARDIFLKLYPEEEFLPRAPDPEDIIMDEGPNPGEHNGFGEENPDLKDIENDVKSDEIGLDETVTQSSNLDTSPNVNETEENSKRDQE